jgi:addiction module RelE/StbE family toxin
MNKLIITERCANEDIPRLPTNVQRTLLQKLEKLQQQPEWGKQLSGNLRKYRSLPISRYRIVYRNDLANDCIFVVAVGIRKEGSSEDIYAQILRLIRAGKLETK